MRSGFICCASHTGRKGQEQNPSNAERWGINAEYYPFFNYRNTGNARTYCRMQRSMCRNHYFAGKIRE